MIWNPSSETHKHWGAETEEYQIGNHLKLIILYHNTKYGNPPVFTFTSYIRSEKGKKMVWEKDQTSGKCNFVYKDLFYEPEACLTHGNVKKNVDLTCSGHALTVAIQALT